jgi:hypothetical protein
MFILLRDLDLLELNVEFGILILLKLYRSLS